MAESLIFLTEPDPERGKKILASLHRVPGATISVFDTLASTRKAMRSRRPDLMIGPWAQGGETMLAARAAMVGSAAVGPVPQLLLLTDRVSPARISMAKQAGRTELIPSDPLDHAALYNRAMLVLCGAEALYDAMETGAGVALGSALENMPALRRRIVA